MEVIAKPIGKGLKNQKKILETGYKTRALGKSCLGRKGSIQRHQTLLASLKPTKQEFVLESELMDPGEVVRFCMFFWFGFVL